ncbi:MAG TPA: hypothetical protein VMQ17_09885 [Candidatus Sulfotelmatobacter sp.]|jgi:hypothetical protein|nr:hypothetical protein [Candidatus Sulfotelmatobacter sp.]
MCSSLNRVGCLLVLASASAVVAAQSQSSLSTSKHIKQSAIPIDSGAVTNSVYRNKSLGLSCKVPQGWVLRTEEMNAPDSDKPADSSAENAASSAAASVLLAAFSRPPAAKGEDVNSSILIAAESVSAYPGLKDAVQYFGPLTEVAKAQGFTADAEPYEIAIGTRALVRADFHKDVGSRVMWQSTLAMLSHGYAVSITLIGGTEDEVENLIESLSFTGSGK